MLNDIAAIRSTVTKLVESGQEVVMVMHSVGEVLGSSAIEGLGIKTRDGAKGCVFKLVFVTAGLCPEGSQPKFLLLFVINVRPMLSFQ